MHAIEANGIHLHYHVLGPETGVPLVFANSLGTDFRIWQALLSVLGEGYRIVLYDKRGHGLSDCPPGPYRIEDHVADLSGLIDALGLGPAVVCGLSVGGLIAQGLSASHPEMVKALVLCDTAHRIGPPEIWDERIRALKAGGIAALSDAILERWFSPAYFTDHAAELVVWRHMLERTPLQGYLGTVAAIRDADMTQAARAIRVPTLCLAGASDGATPPELVKSMADLIPGAGFHIIDGAGHLPCIEQPAPMARLIQTFVKEHNLV